MRSALAFAAVAVATLVAGLIVVSAVHRERDLSAATVRLSVEPGHRGALDVYVPLVDWGTRFAAVRVPARLQVEVQRVDREALRDLSEGGTLDVRRVRAEARDAIASFIRFLIVTAGLGGLAVGCLVAFAVRSRTGPRLRWLIATAGGTAAVGMVALVVLLPPRGAIDRPEYYARGAEIPVALDAVESVDRTRDTLSEELDDQIVGLARLVTEPGGRQSLAGRPRLVVASDLHNNVLALPALERAAGRDPLMFVGDISDRGTPVEARLAGRIVRAGRPLVAVSGNHDSAGLMRSLARRGAVVLTERGRIRPGRRLGPVVVRVAGLRVAGYGDPFLRRPERRYRGADPSPTPAQRRAFSDWLRPLVGRVDVVMVHEPALAADAIAELRRDPPRRSLVVLTGHTHVSSLERERTLTVLNGGTAGAGGTGNLSEDRPIGIAQLVYERLPRFRPLAADLVELDPKDGTATARRYRLDHGDVSVGD